jgi:mono/diheme cytochrome c family protein
MNDRRVFRLSTSSRGRRRTIGVLGFGLALTLLGALTAYYANLIERLSGSGIAQKSVLAEGMAIYGQHCARCHGANLEGQPDWKRRLPSGRLPAPPHDASGHTWHHSDRALLQITKKGTAAVVGGGYESDMPGFEDVLTDEQIRAVLAFIRSTWPERERRFQERVSQSDREARK